MSKYKVTINNKVYEVEVEKVDGDFTAAPVAATPVATTNAAGGSFDSPIQGNVLAVKVKPGQTVKNGQVLVVIEAMKLENEIVSDRDGVIQDVLVTEGTTVNSGQAIVNFRG